MKVLITISSCLYDLNRGCHQAMRDTWLGVAKTIPGLDYKFFIGSGAMVATTPQFEGSWRSRTEKGYEQQVEQPLPEGLVLQPDEVVLPVPDGYKYLAFKTKESHRYALQAGYDHVFQCFTDTYVVPHKLITSGFARHDYVGSKIFNHDVLYAAGGPGYWLSGKACKRLVAQAVTHWAEDVWVGQVMRKHRIRLFDDVRYDNCNVRDFSQAITKHLVFSGKREGKYPTMHEVHAQAMRYAAEHS